MTLSKPHHSEALQLKEVKHHIECIKLVILHCLTFFTMPVPIAAQMGDV